MNIQELVAVITGDLVKSRGLESERSTVIEGIDQIIDKTREYLGTKNCRLLYSGFYRGDSFQYALSDPRYALWSTLFLRSGILTIRGIAVRVDIRLGLGLGTASSWNETNIAASDGEAFQLSGNALDSLKSIKEKYRRLRISTPWPDNDEVFSVLSSCLDALIQRWTPEQAAAISPFLRDKTQDEIAKELRIRQPAVQTRLQTAGHFAIKEANEYFMHVIVTRNIKLDVDNQGI